MSIKTRVYPIRTTKKEWTIPIYCKHLCNIRCSKLYYRNQSDLYILMDNPFYVNGKCEKNNLIESTFIRLSSFNTENPSGISGPLYEPDNIIIPDTNVSVLLSYPLSTCVKINMIARTSKGFTITELIYLIKMIYQYIYKEEEKTSTSKIYYIKKKCISCENNKNYFLKDELKPLDETQECSVCYDKYSNTNKACKLLCKHIFHKTCILKWLETSKTCPLCRKIVKKCNVCNDSGFIYCNYTGVVIPVKHRGVISNRNTTDGVFGIFGYDLEDLLIENIHYNKEIKLLTLNICV